MNKSTKRWIIIGGIVIALTGVMGYLVLRFPQGLENQDSQIRLVQAILLVSVFLVPTLLYSKIKTHQVMNAAVIWGGLGVLLFIGYAFRDEASIFYDRLVGELLPKSAQVTGNTAVIRMGQGGHYAVEATVDGVRVAFLVDTGASDVVLSPKDAQRLGFGLETLRYSKTYRTANGTVQGAPVTLGRMEIGNIQITDVRASVNKADMNQSLLGMSFLGRLSGVEIRGNSLILTR